MRADIALFPQSVFGADKLDNRPVARIRLTPDTAVHKNPLFAQILRRHTNRSRYDITRAVPAAAWLAMQEALKRYPLRFGYVGAEQAEGLAVAGPAGIRRV